MTPSSPTPKVVRNPAVPTGGHPRARAWGAAKESSLQPFRSPLPHCHCPASSHRKITSTSTNLPLLSQTDAEEEAEAHPPGASPWTPTCRPPCPPHPAPPCTPLGWDEKPRIAMTPSQWHSRSVSTLLPTPGLCSPALPLVVPNVQQNKLICNQMLLLSFTWRELYFLRWKPILASLQAVHSLQTALL